MLPFGTLVVAVSKAQDTFLRCEPEARFSGPLAVASAAGPPVVPPGLVAGVSSSSTAVIADMGRSNVWLSDEDEDIASIEANTSDAALKWCWDWLLVRNVSVEVEFGNFDDKAENETGIDGSEGSSDGGLSFWERLLMVWIVRVATVHSHQLPFVLSLTTIHICAAHCNMAGVDGELFRRCT